jgi:hypothetical protein
MRGEGQRDDALASTRKEHSWMACCPLLLRMKQEHLGDPGAFERGIEALNRRDVEAIGLDPTPTDFYLP